MPGLQEPERLGSVYHFQCTFVARLPVYELNRFRAATRLRSPGVQDLCLMLCLGLFRAYNLATRIAKQHQLGQEQEPEAEILHSTTTQLHLI